MQLRDVREQVQGWVRRSEGLPAAEVVGKAAVASSERAPSRQAAEIFADLAGRVDSQVEELRTVIRKDLAAFEELLRESNVPLVRVPAEH